MNAGVCGLAPIYPLKLLHVVQVGLLTNAQVEELLPLGAHRISLGLETRVSVDRRRCCQCASSPMTSTLEGGDGRGWTYLDQRAGRVLHLHKPVSFLLELVHLLLMQQQVVVLEVLIQIRYSLACTWAGLLWALVHTSSRWQTGAGGVHYLVLPADVRRVRHVVAPVLLPDLVLLLRQELQLLVAGLRVVVQAAQVVLTPL